VNLFENIIEMLRSSTSIRNFNKSTHQCVKDWQVAILKDEKSVFVGIRSYEAMCSLNKQPGRHFVGASEILQKLQVHPFVTQYLNIIDDSLTAESIIYSSVIHRFALKITNLYGGDVLMMPIPPQEFRERSMKLIKVVTKAC
jgi:hypothetical protein